MRMVMLGPPGAGKGTQARTLAEWNIPQIASGDLLRAAVREKTEPGAGHRYMDRGQLVPDELVLKLIEARLDRSDAKRGIYPGRISAQRAAGGSAGRDARTAWETNSTKSSR